VQFPSNHHVARRVAHAHLTPIDHTADAAVANKPIARIEVAVVPNRWSIPGRCGDRPSPLRPHRRGSLEPGQPVLELLVALSQRNAAPGRRAGRAHLLHGRDECRKVAGGLGRIDLLDRHCSALDPGVDLPEPRIAVAGSALRDRDGDVDREQWRQPRQPVEFLAAGLDGPVTAREPHREIVTEAKDRVDRAARLQPTQLSLGPFGELFAEQATYELFIDLKFVDMHSCSHAEA
jgi:hypothetical protein